MLSVVYAAASAVKFIRNFNNRSYSSSVSPSLTSVTAFPSNDHFPHSHHTKPPLIKKLLLQPLQKLHQKRRRGYVHFPEITCIPLMRGWCLLPILLYHTLLITIWSPATTWFCLAHDVLFELHLLIGAAYHLSPFIHYELLLRKVDLCLILWSCSSILMTCLHRLGGFNFISFALLSFSVILGPVAWMYHRLNLIANAIVPIVGLTTLAIVDSSIYPLLTWHSIFNLSSMTVAGVAYVIELSGKLPMKNPIIGWHDIFHLVVSIVYLHRLHILRPMTFLMADNQDTVHWL